MEFQRKILYILSSVFALVLFLVNLPSFAAFEAHHIGVTANFKAPEVKLLVSKVYYDPDEKHGGETCGANEWVEIYNPSGYAVDLKDWQICDNYECDTLRNSSLVMQPGDFAIITKYTATFDYWNVPGNVKKIVLNQAIGNKLGNASDMIALKSPNGNIVDQMNWGTPNSGWPNYNFGLWNPGIADAPEGHMLGRIPLNPGPGFQDTDAVADWQDFALPEIGNIEVYQYGSKVLPDGNLHGDRPANIKWQAVNPNGSDSDLEIDLHYIMDTNSNGVLDDTDEIHIIAENIANTGSYDWTVYSYPGYIWIRVIAIGPENFMISASEVGYRIYEPLASEDEENAAEATSNPAEEAPVQPQDDEIEESSVGQEVQDEQQEKPQTEENPVSEDNNEDNNEGNDEGSQEEAPADQDADNESEEKSSIQGDGENTDDSNAQTTDEDPEAEEDLSEETIDNTEEVPTL